jgi:hypothetical protein
MAQVLTTERSWSQAPAHGRLVQGGAARAYGQPRRRGVLGLEAEHGPHHLGHLPGPATGQPLGPHPEPAQPVVAEPGWSPGGSASHGRVPAPPCRRTRPARSPVYRPPSTAGWPARRTCSIPGGRDVGVQVGALVANGGRVEHAQVGHRALDQQAAAVEAELAGPQPGGLADGLLPGEDAQLAHVAAEQSGEAAPGPRVLEAARGAVVGADADQGAGHDGPHVVLAHQADDDGGRRVVGDQLAQRVPGVAAAGRLGQGAAGHARGRGGRSAARRRGRPGPSRRRRRRRARPGRAGPPGPRGRAAGHAMASVPPAATAGGSSELSTVAPAS